MASREETHDEMHGDKIYEREIARLQRTITELEDKYATLAGILMALKPEIVIPHCEQQHGLPE